MNKKTNSTKKPNKAKQLVRKLSDDQTKGAQKNLLEEVFYDLYPSRWQIYKVNFFRGLSFGFGSAIGASVLIVLAVMILNLFVNIPGGIGEFVRSIIDAMNSNSSI